MSEKKPVPVRANTARKVCPVCGTASYSQTGTHPQCALAREDALSKAARKETQLKVEASEGRKSWAKPCPKCKRQIPARRYVCDCGHKFANLAAKVVTSGRAAAVAGDVRKRR